MSELRRAIIERALTDAASRAAILCVDYVHERLARVAEPGDVGEQPTAHDERELGPEGIETFDSWMRRKRVRR